MQKFSLELEAPIKGIYLNTETIDLLSIIQCKKIDELKDFAINDPQLSISKEDLINWDESNIDDIKKDLVDQYKNSLVSMERSIENPVSVKKSILQHLGIDDKEIDSYISVLQNEGYEGITQKLKIEHPKNYTTFAEKVHRFIGMERDQLLDVTYEELSGINDVLSNHNTILIATGCYCNIADKMYDEQIPGMKKYDFDYLQRSLDFCHKNGMHVRYHALLDKHTLQDMVGKNKEDVIKELEEYVRQSIDFISNYNEKYKINGKGAISSVDLFNEIISFDEPYKNIWEETFGISTEELMEVFQYALDNKPDGVTYVYNEPFLEDSERRQAVIEQLSKFTPGLIDTIGTQMHIEMSLNTQSIDDIRQSFEDFKRLEDLEIGTQITEFDMCLPEKFMFDENGKVQSEKDLIELINRNSNFTVGSIAEFKKIKMSEISKAIEETGIHLDGITYWSISDTLDHNLERTNMKTYEQGLSRDIAQTRYSGLYSGLEKSKTISTQRLGQETLEEQKDTSFLDEIESIQAKQQRDIAKQRDTQEDGQNR